MPTLTWTIENYSKIVLETGECIKSPAFLIDQGKQKWMLKCYPYGDGRDPNYVSCYLCGISGIKNNNVSFAFKLMSPDGEIFHSQPMEDMVFNENSVWGRALKTIEALKNKMKEWATDVLTIQCAMNFKISNTIPSFDFQAKSKIGFNEVTFGCCVKEPDSLYWCERKVFKCTEKTSLEIILTAAEDNILMEVNHISNVDVGQLNITGKFIVIDVTNVEQFTIEDTHMFLGSRNNNSWKIPTFVTKKALRNKKCIENGSFTLILEFSVPNGIVTNKIICDEINYAWDNSRIKSPMIRVDAITALHRDLKQMLLDKKHADVNLKADDQLFPVHKCVLASRSPVFRAMFDSEMLENQSNVVEINDLDSITLDSFVKFLYIGAVDNSSCENTLKLMLAADKYQVESLIDKCSEILRKLLSPENVCEIIFIADMVKHHYLKTAALNLIQDNSEEILSSTKWSEWSMQNLHLALEITSKLAIRCSSLKRIQYNNA